MSRLKAAVSVWLGERQGLGLRGVRTGGFGAGDLDEAEGAGEASRGTIRSAVAGGLRSYASGWWAQYRSDFWPAGTEHPTEQDRRRASYPTLFDLGRVGGRDFTIRQSTTEIIFGAEEALRGSLGEVLATVSGPAQVVIRPFAAAQATAGVGLAAHGAGMGLNIAFGPDQPPSTWQVLSEAIEANTPSGGAERVLQRGGNTINKSTARALNVRFGVNVERREWGRALESLKRENGLSPSDHGAITESGDYLDGVGNVVDNLGDYLP